MRQKYDAVVSALGGAGFSVVQEEWEEREYDYLDGTANAIVEVRANPSACYDTSLTIDCGDATLARTRPVVLC